MEEEGAPNRVYPYEGYVKTPFADAVGSVFCSLYSGDRVPELMQDAHVNEIVAMNRRNIERLTCQRGREAELTAPMNVPMFDKDRYPVQTIERTEYAEIVRGGRATWHDTSRVRPVLREEEFQRLLREMKAFHTAAGVDSRKEHVRSRVEVVAVPLAGHPLSKKGGHGAVALMDLPAGSFLGQHTGTVSRAEEADYAYSFEYPVLARRRRKGEHDPSGMFIDRSIQELNLVVSADRAGNELRFVNDFHGYVDDATAPLASGNVESFHYYFNGNVRVGYTTSRPVVKGEELLIDYGAGYWHGAMDDCEKKREEAVRNKEMYRHRLRRCQEDLRDMGLAYGDVRGRDDVSAPDSESCYRCLRASKFRCACGATYCSEECREKDWDVSHRFICPESDVRSGE